MDEHKNKIEMMHFRVSCIEMALDHHRLEGNTTKDTDEVVNTASKFMKFIEDGENTDSV